MDLTNLQTRFLSVSWHPVQNQEISIHWGWVSVAILSIFSIYLLLRSADFILSRLYWTSWKPATAMMALLVTAYACKKAVDFPQSVASHMLPVSTRMIDGSVSQRNGESVKYSATLKNNFVNLALQQ